MARQGRFGRSETGASNLSATIRSLVAQQSAQEEQMLFKAFFDQTEFGGRIPTYSDLVNLVNERISSGGASDAQIAYYDNLLASAKEQQNTSTYKSLMGEFKRTGGENLREVLSFLSGEGEAQFGDDIYNVVNGYVQDSKDRLKSGSISVEEYNAISEDILGATSDYPALYEDSKFNTMFGLYEYERDYQQQQIDSVAGKKLEKVLAKNKELLAWKQGWASKFFDAGFETASIYTALVSSISSNKTVINTLEKKVAQKQIAAFVSAKEQQYLADKKPLDDIARQVALDLGIDAGDDFTLTDLNKENPAAFNFWLSGQSQETRQAVTGLVSDLQSSANSYVRASSKNDLGDTEKVRSALQTVSSAQSSLGLDTTYNDYQMALIQKVKLMTVASGVPSSEKLISEQWVSFLSGKSTDFFGSGITKSQDDETQQMLENEVSLTQSYLRGETVALTPKTLSDVMTPALAELGLISLPVIPDQFKSLDSKYTAVEMQNILDSSKNAEDVAYGRKQVFREPYVDKDGEIDFKTSIVPTGVQSPGLGTVVRFEQDPFGNPYQAIYKGIPIYASKAGAPSTDNESLWGYATTTADGNVIYSSKNGTQYSKPPFDLANIALSSQVVSGSEQPIYIAMGQSVGVNKNTGKIMVNENKADQAIKTTINDYVAQSIIDQAKNPNLYSGMNLKTPEWYRDADVKKKLNQETSISLGVADLLSGLSNLSTDEDLVNTLSATATDIVNAASSRSAKAASGMLGDIARIRQASISQMVAAPKLSQRTYPVTAGGTSYVSLNGQLPGSLGITIEDAFRKAGSIKPQPSTPWSPVSSTGLNVPMASVPMASVPRYTPTPSSSRTTPQTTASVPAALTVSAMPFNPQDPEARRALIMGQKPTASTMPFNPEDPEERRALLMGQRPAGSSPQRRGGR